MIAVGKGGAVDYKKLLQAPDGWTDEQLLKEFKKAEAEVMEAGGPKAEKEPLHR